MHEKESLTFEVLEKLINRMFANQFPETEPKIKNKKQTNENNNTFSISEQNKNTKTDQTKKTKDNIFYKINKQKKQSTTSNQLSVKKEESETLPTKSYVLEVIINDKIKKRFFLKEPLKPSIDNILYAFETNTAKILKEKVIEAINLINNDNKKIYNSNFILSDSKYEIKFYIAQKNTTQLISTSII